MLRLINNLSFLFLCQSADWQCVVEAEDEESAATIAIEKVMQQSKSEKVDYSLSMVVAVKKISQNLIEESNAENCIAFYSPIILANAGFHNESASLHKVLQNQIDQDNNE